MSMFSMIFEGSVAIILVMVAGLCWRLDRRLTALKNGQDGVRRNVVELADAAVRAQEGIRGLRLTSDEAGRALEEKIERARALADELVLLTEQGAHRTPGRDDHRSNARPAMRRDDRGAERGDQRDETPRADVAAGRGARRLAAFAEEADANPRAAEILDRLRGVR